MSTAKTTKLTKHKGTTEDTRGTSFEYTCYQTKQFTVDGWKTIECDYVDSIFGMSAKDLDTLKKMMGEK